MTFIRSDVKMDVNYTSTNMSRKAHFSVGNTNLIGMIRARKLAIKIKKRAQFLVAHKRRRENTGRAILVHHDFPGLNTTSAADGVLERMIISSSGEKLQTHAAHDHKTVPVDIFPTLSVEEHMRRLLRVRMDGVKYDPLTCKELSKNLAEEIKQDVKTYHNLSRYKLIVLSTLERPNINVMFVLGVVACGMKSLMILRLPFIETVTFLSSQQFSGFILNR